MHNYYESQYSNASRCIQAGVPVAAVGNSFCHGVTAEITDMGEISPAAAQRRLWI